MKKESSEKEDKLLEAVGNCLSSGDEPMSIVEACREGMEEVGSRFAAGEFYVNELICSADLFGRVMKVLGPQLSARGSGATKGRVVIGTVKGDVHDIGKDIVVAMLRCNGFEVYDLGVNIPAQQFVDKVRETGAKVVALSGLLTLAFDGMEETVQALKAAGLHPKVMIGGGMTNETAWVVRQAGLGQSTVVGIGGDIIIGCAFADLLKLFENDKQTKGVVIFGELGGTYEEQIADLMKEGGFTKPLAAFIAGNFTEQMPEGMSFGHAGALIQGEKGRPKHKMKLLKEAGAIVVGNHDELGEAIKKAI